MLSHGLRNQLVLPTCPLGQSDVAVSTETRTSVVRLTKNDGQVNGIEKGRGTGRSQKTAKEDAVRQAWALMGGFSCMHPLSNIHYGLIAKQFDFNRGSE